ncbi:hypothetical protein Hanom_Chr06g00540571 [Helianthus anomalus]
MMSFSSDSYINASCRFVFSFTCIYGYNLIIVFLRFGEFIMGGAHFPLTVDALKKVLTGKASNEILLSIVAKLDDLITGAISRYTDVYLIKQFNRTKPNKKS